MATYNYFYTLEIWGNSDSSVTNPTITEQSNDQPLTYPSGWLKLMPESSSTSLTGGSFTIQQGCEIKVRIRFYQQVVGGSSAGIYWLTNHDLNNAHFVMNDSGKWDAKSNVYSLTAESAYSGSQSNISGVANPNGGTVMYFTAIANQTFTSSTPFMSFVSTSSNGWAGGITPNSMSSSNHGDTRTTTQIPTLIGTSPTIKVMASKPIPPVPPALITAVTNAAETSATQNLIGSSQPGTVYYAFNPCDPNGGKWYGLAITVAIPGTGPGKPNEAYAVYSCNIDNTGLTRLEGKPEPISGGMPLQRAAIARLKEYGVGDCSEFKSTKTVGGGNSSTTASPFPPEITLPNQWNPPTYSGSRLPAYTERPGGVGFGQFNLNNVVGSLESLMAQTDQLAYNVYSNPKYGTNTITQILAASSATNQGKIFQDSYTATALNSYQSNLSLKGTTKANQWGFKFMYNPTSISYSTTSNNTVDFSNKNNDPSALMQGNSQVTFDLYLNRILDMTALQNAELMGNDPTVSDIGYGRPLGKDEMYGILYRGTEYDIEYLYRVLNGNPQSGSQLLSDEYKKLGGVTSDFGYTTAIPVWLWLHDNLRYYGSVSNFQVDHVMFDLRMVPILSVLSITFSRYPALNSSNSIFGEAAIATAGTTVANGAIAGTGTTSQ
jgi:hypothetical protein